MEDKSVRYRRETQLLTRKFIRENFSKEKAREALIYSESFSDEEIEQELKYIYESSLDILNKEDEQFISLTHNKGFMK